MTKSRSWLVHKDLYYHYHVCLSAIAYMYPIELPDIWTFSLNKIYPLLYIRQSKNDILLSISIYIVFVVLDSITFRTIIWCDCQHNTSHNKTASSHWTVRGCTSKAIDLDVCIFFFHSLPEKKDEDFYRASYTMKRARKDEKKRYSHKKRPNIYNWESRDLRSWPKNMLSIPIVCVGI